jgi:hypothetical protein
VRLALTLTAVLATTSPVPDSIQRSISRDVPARLRYVPAEVPAGYQFAKWHYDHPGLEISFAREGRRPTLTFIAGPSGPPGTCDAGGTHAYRFRSVRVSFERDRYIEQFWRCVHAGSVSIAATIRRTDVLTAAKRRAIAAMVASATQLR